MEVVLLERVEKLGQMGDVVKVKPGFGRNFLLPQGKALRATKDNLKVFEAQRAQLEARNLEERQEAEQVGKKLDGNTYVAVRQSSETGQLYGSVTPRDISQAITEGGFSLHRNQVVLDKPIKTLGMHEVRIALHPEFHVTITMNVARSEEEAERQASGENILARLEDDEDEDLFDEDEFFEEDGEDADNDSEGDDAPADETADSGADEDDTKA